MMTPSRPSESTQPRMRILMIVVGCLFASLLARLWFLQIIDTSVAAAQVSSQGVVTLYTSAPRGEILDRNGKVLVGNRAVEVIEVSRQEVSTRAVTTLAALLGEPVKSLRAAINNNQYLPVDPVPVSTDPPAAKVLYVDEHAAQLPGVHAVTVTEPYVTRLGRYAGDTIGYVGQVDAQELASLQKTEPTKHYQPGDTVGQTGIEAELQNSLAGTPGVERIQVNAQGQELGVLSSTPPVPGDNVKLTLKGAIQEVADTSILQGQRVARGKPADTGVGNYKSPGGSAVVENPNNGQVLALATEPTFNPEAFNRGISPAEYEALVNNPDDPLEDRAIQGEYAPGSTFKLATATAGLHDGIVTPSYIFNDTRGSIDVAGHIFHDDGGIGAGYIDLAQALTVSSDNYFNTIGENLWDSRAKYGPLALQRAAKSYGFGSPTGIDLPDENAGLIPTPAQQVQLHKQEPNNPDAPGYWDVGDSIEMAIGQFQDEVTPLQLANAYSTFTDGGTRHQPNLVLDVQSPSGRIIKRFAARIEGHSESLSASDRQAIIQGYLGVTHSPSGTGYPVFGTSSLSGKDIAGKTGTAQVSGAGNQDTSVFMGFAPATRTRYVVDCFMEDSGYGESIAAPIVRRIYDQIYHKPLNPVAFQPVTGSPG